METMIIKSRDYQQGYYDGYMSGQTIANEILVQYMNSQTNIKIEVTPKELNDLLHEIKGTKNKVTIIEIHNTKRLTFGTGFNRIGVYPKTDCGFLINLFFVSFLIKKRWR